MKALALLALGLLLAGCAKDNEDRAFFEQGWIKPEAGANERMYGTREKITLDKPARRDAR